MIQPPLFALQGGQVGEGLGGVKVSAIPCVDHRALGVKSSRFGCTLQGMPHGQNVGVAGDNADGVGEVFPFAHRGVLDCQTQ